MKKIYYVSTRDVADGIVNEATVIKETEKTYIAKIAGYERTLRKGDMKCGTIETFYAFEEYTDALMWLKDRADLHERICEIIGKEHTDRAILDITNNLDKSIGFDLDADYNSADIRGFAIKLARKLLEV